MTQRSRDNSHTGPDSDDEGDNYSGWASWWWILGTTIVATFLVLVLIQSFVGRVYVVPSASMKPTLQGCENCENDRIVVDKLAYRFGSPEVGDVAVFEAPESWEAEVSVSPTSNRVARGLNRISSALGLRASEDNIYVKRVIATEDHTVACEPGDAGVKVDGRALSENYLFATPNNTAFGPAGSPECGGAYFGPVTVPDDHVWMMGDNRTNSIDSRAHLGNPSQGAVPVDNLQGKVRGIILPWSRFGPLDS